MTSHWHPDAAPPAKAVPVIGCLPAEQNRYGYGYKMASMYPDGVPLLAYGIEL